MNARGLMAVACSLALIGCGRGDGQWQWGDIGESQGMPVLDPVTVVEGDVWRFDVGLEPYDTGEPPRQCLQPVVAGQPLGCTPVEAEGGAMYGFNAVVRAGDERVIWDSTTIDTARPVDHFVVWSSAAPDGRRLDPITYSDVQILLWIMAPGEAPWGYQAIAPDGTLVERRSFVGLPAD